MDLEAEYNNRARVPGHMAIMQGWARDSAAWREACPKAELGLAYGPGEREKLDLFWPTETGAGDAPPMALFIHGGYWQALGREWVSFCARGLNLAGVAVAVPSYDLCPSVPLATIVAQMEAAARFLHRRHGVPLLAAGHSAGGHLAACLLAALPAEVVAAALPVSGLFELEPLVPTSVNAALRLAPEEARRLSPRHWPSPARPLHAVVGGAESGEYLRQSRDFAATWGGSFEALDGADHFTVLAPFAEPAHPVTTRAAAMALQAADPSSLK